METNQENESKVIRIKKTGSISGLIMFLILLIAISLFAFVIYLKSEGYSFNSLKVQDAFNYLKKNQTIKAQQKTDIPFLQDGSADCKLYNDYIVVLTKDSLKWYDRTGKLLQENAMTLTQPVLRISKKYLAVIDISGRNIFFYKDKTQLWTRRLDNQIINADINDGGYSTVVTQSTEYKSAVQVLDINGAVKYTKLCAEDIVLGAKAIHNGQDVLINKVATNGIRAGTQFEFNNIYEEKPFSAINFADTIMPIMLTYGDNEAAIGKNAVLFVDKQGKELWRKSIDSVYCAALNSEKYIIVAAKTTGSDGKTKDKVLVLDLKGETIYSFDQPESVVGMQLYDNRLLLRTQRSIYIYSIKGEKLGSYLAKNEIKDAYLVEDDNAIIISGGNISLVHIKQQ